MRDPHILLCDIHLGLHKASDIWHSVSINLIKSVIDICVKRNIKKIDILGDFFHERKNIHAKTLDSAISIAELLKNFDVTIIPGNHDVFHKDTIIPTSLDIFSEYKNIEVIKEVECREDLVYCPWNKTDELLNKQCNDKILLGHLEINGFATSEHYIYNGSKLNIDFFKKFKKVYTGHFHVPSEIGNIKYLGAPFQMNFGDVGGYRGFHILDENDNLEFIEFTDAPKYTIISTRRLPKLEEIQNNIVKVVFLRDYGTNKNTKILDYIQRFKPISLISDFSRITEKDYERKENSENDISVPIKSHKELLFENMKKNRLPHNLNMETMRKMVDMLLKNSGV
jgi:DNA repair exonuclease SbcCD nuclease subunit